MSDRDPSRIPGFYRLGVGERVERLASRSDLSADARAFLTGKGRLDLEAADHMVENCIGTFDLPLGVGLNLRLNGEDRLVPLAIEEPSVVAGLSKAAILLRAGDGIRAEADASVMVGQVQIVDVADPERARERILADRKALLHTANQVDSLLGEVGGGARDLEVRVLERTGDEDPEGAMVVVHLLVDVVDAMGANAVNTMAERLAPRLGELAGGRVVLRILSNLADRRLVRVRGVVRCDRLAPNGHGGGGSAVARDVQSASVFAERDPYRAATHNKGIMNGVDGALIAFGQDFRAVEAGAHAFAARAGRYQALTRWRVDGEDLVGTLTMPLAVGTVGGVVRDHPAVRAAHELAGIRSARDLACLVGAVGLTQNLAALLALVTEGIQRGHMRLHARKLARAVGARPKEIDDVCAAIQERGIYDREHAREVLAALRAEG